MPSTLIHVGVAALIGTALLSDYFDTRAVLIVMAIAVLPDLDTFIGMWLIDGGHRAVLHNLVIPTALLALLLWDVHLREESYVLDRWGTYGYRVAWVSLLGAWIVAHVLLDAFYNGVNLLWPLHDEFIDLSGHLLISDQRGIEQTFLEFETAEDGTRQVAEDHTRGTTEDTHYFTIADPAEATGEGEPERWTYLFDRGTYMVIAVTGYLAAAFRIWETWGDREE